MKFYEVVSFLLFSAGLYIILSRALHLPSRRARKRMEKVSSQAVKEPLLRRLYAALSRPLAGILSRRIRLPTYKRASLRKKLARARIPATPEEYYANAISIGVLVSLASIPFILLGVPILAIAMPLFGILLYFREIQRVDDALKTLNEQIAAVLPQFVSIVIQRLEMDKDITRILELYLRDVPGTPLRGDLEKLLARVNANGNMEDALRELDASINADAFSSFVTGLIDVTRGVDQSLHLEMVSAKMRQMAEENLRRITLKRPEKVKRVTLTMAASLILVYLTPMIMQIIDGFKQFK